jgi:hypothetical protein
MAGSWAKTLGLDDADHLGEGGPRPDGEPPPRNLEW